MRRARFAALGLAAVTASMGFFPQLGSATRRLGDVATIEVPRKARLDAPQLRHEAPTWVGYRLTRVHGSAMGSLTPYRATLFIALQAPGAGDASHADALRFATGELNGGADDWKLLERTERWEVGAGRYTVNGLNEATWRLAYRDPTRRVSALWQVFQQDWSLGDARDALVTMVESTQRVREPDFGAIADRPRAAADENERKVRAALAWLAQRGYTPLASGQPVTRDGITVEYMTDPERRLMLYKPIAGQPSDPLPAYVSYGWRVRGDTGWEYHMANNGYYPMPGTTRLLNRTQAGPGPHHFLIRTVRLDEMDEADFHLANFLAIAARVR